MLAIRRACVRPAVLLFVTLWAISGLAIWLAGATDLLLSRLPFIAYYLVFAGITILITRPASPAASCEKPGRNVWMQLGFIAIVIVLTAITGLAFHGAIAENTPITFHYRLYDVLGRYTNSVVYFLIPLPMLLLLGATFSGLGFRRGHRVLLVSALWCVVPIVFWIVGLAGGSLTLGGLAARLISNAIQNGFFEEFLFRGALQTRLRLFLSPSTAIVISSLTFGLWHLGLGYSDAGSLPGAIAVLIFSLSVYGIGFGVIMERTRNLAASSIAHVATNAIG